MGAFEEHFVGIDSVFIAINGVSVAVDGDFIVSERTCILGGNRCIEYSSDERIGETPKNDPATALRCLAFHQNHRCKKLTFARSTISSPRPLSTAFRAKRLKPVISSMVIVGG